MIVTVDSPDQLRRARPGPPRRGRPQNTFFQSKGAPREAAANLVLDDRGTGLALALSPLRTKPAVQEPVRHELAVR